MKTKLAKIGNSQGVRIPKPLIEEAGLSGGELDMTVEGGALVIRRVRKVREGWAESFELMAKEEGLGLLDPEVTWPLTSFDEEEWEWDEDLGDPE